MKKVSEKKVSGTTLRTVLEYFSVIKLPRPTIEIFGAGSRSREFDGQHYTGMQRISVALEKRAN